MLPNDNQVKVKMFQILARAITLPVARAIIPKSHSNPCDYLYKFIGCVYINHHIAYI